MRQSLRCATRCSRSSIRRSAAALKDRWSYASGSTYQRIIFLRTALTGVPSPPRTPGRRRSGPVGRPARALGLGARREAVVRLSGRPRVGPGATDLLPERREQASTSTSSADGNLLSVALVRHRASA